MTKQTWIQRETNGTNVGCGTNGAGMLYRQESLAMISLAQMVVIPKRQIGATKPGIMDGRQAKP
jgi:hypothetical protein